MLKQSSRANQSHDFDRSPLSSSAELFEFQALVIEMRQLSRNPPPRSHRPTSADSKDLRGASGISSEAFQSIKKMALSTKFAPRSGIALETTNHLWSKVQKQHVSILVFVQSEALLLGIDLRISFRRPLKDAVIIHIPFLSFKVPISTTIQWRSNGDHWTSWRLPC